MRFSAGCSPAGKSLVFRDVNFRERGSSAVRGGRGRGLVDFEDDDEVESAVVSTFTAGGGLGVDE